MASIGPQLPPQPAKRKRTPENEAAQSPPSKLTRRANDDEIPLDEDDDSEDGYGPVAAAPPTPSSAPAPTARQPIGPSAPAPNQTHNKDEIALDSDSEDYGPSAGRAPAPHGPVGPALPSQQPASKRPPLDDNPTGREGKATAPNPPGPARRIGPSLPSPSKPVQGPTLPSTLPISTSSPPPGPAAVREADPDSDSESDSDYGPALPSAASASRAGDEPSPPPSSLPQAAPTAPQRDAWMLAPPTADETKKANDPTRLKARKFASGRAATASADAGGISSIWTETAGEKAKRLADAVLGRTPDNHNPSASMSSAAVAAQAARDRQQAERDARIRAQTESARGRSLYEEHQAAIKEGRSGAAGPGGGSKAAKEEEDDPSKRAFDREKDMGLGMKITASKRRELVNRAADFGGRFQKGKYL